MIGWSFRSRKLTATPQTAEPTPSPPWPTAPASRPTKTPARPATPPLRGLTHDSSGRPGAKEGASQGRPAVLKLPSEPPPASLSRTNSPTRSHRLHDRSAHRCGFRAAAGDHHASGMDHPTPKRVTRSPRQSSRAGDSLAACSRITCAHFECGHCASTAAVAGSAISSEPRSCVNFTAPSLRRCQMKRRMSARVSTPKRLATSRHSGPSPVDARVARMKSHTSSRCASASAPTYAFTARRCCSSRSARSATPAGGVLPGAVLTT